MTGIKPLRPIWAGHKIKQPRYRNKKGSKIEISFLTFFQKAYRAGIEIDKTVIYSILCEIPFSKKRLKLIK